MESRHFAGGARASVFAHRVPPRLPKRRARRRIKNQAAKVTET